MDEGWQQNGIQVKQEEQDHPLFQTTSQAEHGQGFTGIPSTSSSDTLRDASIIDEIQRKMGEIVSGFPLPSAMGLTSVVSHLPPLIGERLSSFPETRPEAYTSDPAKKRFTVENDIQFGAYSREMDLLMGSARLKDSSVERLDFENLRQSAHLAVADALQHYGHDLSRLTYKDPPYRLPDSYKITKPVGSSSSKRYRRQDLARTSIAREALTVNNVPFPSPLSTQTPSSDSQRSELRALPPLASDLDAWVGKAAKTVDKKLPPATTSAHTQAKAAFTAFLATQAEALEAKSDAPASSPAKKLFSATTTAGLPPSPVTPRKRDSSVLTGDLPPSSPLSFASALSQQAPSSPDARFRKGAHLLLPTTPSGTSSPDPLRFGSSPSTVKKAKRSPIVVVEVPRKRLPSLPIHQQTQKKSLKVASQAQGGHTVFSEPTSEMDVDYHQDRDHEEDVNTPVRKEGRLLQRRGDFFAASSSAPSSPTKPSHLQSGKTKAEALFEKCNSHIQKILEAEEALLILVDVKSATKVQGEQADDDDDQVALANKYFICEGTGGRARYRRDALLRPKVIGKIITVLEALVKTSGGKRLFSDQVDPDDVSRLLKLLERSIAVAERLQIVPSGVQSQPIADSPKKGRKSTESGKRKGNGKKSTSESPSVRKSRRSSRSATPAKVNEDDEEDELASEEEKEEEDDDDGEYTSDASSTRSASGKGSASRRSKALSKGKGIASTRRRSRAKEDAAEGSTEPDWSSEHLRKLDANVETLGNALLAIEACLSILTAGRLAKHLYSEDLIGLCLRVLKYQLSAFVYVCTDSSSSLMTTPLCIAETKDSIRECLVTVSIVLPKLAALLKQEKMPSAVVNDAAYLAIGPFFVECGARIKGKDEHVGSAEMKVIQNQALGLIRIVFAREVDQRQWIIKEVLASVTKLPDLAKRKPQYMLKHGKAVHTSSILLLHLVQSCTSGAREDMSALLAKQLKRTDSDSSAAKGEEDDELEAGPSSSAATQLVESLMGSATRCGFEIIDFLLERSGKAPKNSTATEAEYKVFLDNFMKDLLVVIDLPEWPVAPLMLQIAVKRLMGRLEDKKTSADVNAMKGISLDLLGAIGAKLHNLAVESKASASQEEKSTVLSPLVVLTHSQDYRGLRRLASAQEGLIEGLLRSSEEDEVETAIDYASAKWAMELIQTLKILPELQKTQAVKPKFEHEVSTRLEALWQITKPASAFQMDDDGKETLAQTWQDLFPSFGLQHAMDGLLKQILYCCAEGAVISFRQKALKALSAIVAEDPTIFARDHVQTAVKNRLSDPATSVRDTALEMLGRYIVQQPQLALHYLPSIAIRTTDAGPSVRKRTVKLLRSIYPLLDSIDSQVEICARLVGRIRDEDDGIKDLAVTAIDEIWFQRKPNSKHQNNNDHLADPHAKRQLRSKCSIITRVAGGTREKSSPMEEMVRAIIYKYNTKGLKDPQGRHAFAEQLKDIVDTLTEMLVESLGTTTSNAINSVKAVYILLLADHRMLTIDRAKELLPYLQSTTTDEEKTIAEYLLKIYASCLPAMPTSAGPFAANLQQRLTKLLNSPTDDKGIVPFLPDLVACFCAVIIYQTYDYSRLCSVFTVCKHRMQQGLQQLVSKANALAAPDRVKLQRSVMVVAHIVSLFCQYADFDGLRESSPDASIQISKITKTSIRDEVYDQVVEAYHLSAGSPLFRKAALQCLGYIFCAHPQKMLDGPSLELIDKIFEQKQDDAVNAKSIVLRLICDVLVTQTYRTQEEGLLQDDMDMAQLVGTTIDNFDTGVPSTIVQRYLDNIAEAALDPNTAEKTLRPALEIIGFAVKLGLAHPKDLLPVLVALETSDTRNVADKAFALHDKLHNSFTSVIMDGMAATVRKVFDFQARLKGFERLSGYSGDPPSALLNRWYSFMRDKRAWRNDFLRILTREYHVEAGLEKNFSQGDLQYIRFLVENLASLDYKTQEEVFQVIRAATETLSTSGIQAYHLLQAAEFDDSTENSDTPTQSASLLRKSISYAFVLRLRDHLKQLYNITDQKQAKYTFGKKSALGDKAATNKAGAEPAIDYSGLPFIQNVMVTTEDFRTQQQAYISMIDADGTFAEAANDEDDD